MKTKTKPKKIATAILVRKVHCDFHFKIQSASWHSKHYSRQVKHVGKGRNKNLGSHNLTAFRSIKRKQEMGSGNKF